MNFKKKLTKSNILKRSAKLMNNNHTTVWIEDVDKHDTKCIGLDRVHNILCITVAHYTETGDNKSYSTIAEIAVDKETFISALEFLDLTENLAP